MARPESISGRCTVAVRVEGCNVSDLYFHRTLFQICNRWRRDTERSPEKHMEKPRAITDPQRQHGLTRGFVGVVINADIHQQRWIGPGCPLLVDRKGLRFSSGSVQPTAIYGRAIHPFPGP